ncbi:hypothetical protein F2Q69_00035092 [Brassica cretica]|uniref:Uncharacterized protein n=1 Tax=Brassica cretica TaxID=69181 RepID=A0A8S9SAB2_BRACR|nr:hypothetical protein F2Q69_00035092 [Brassica cretica]
MLDAPQGRFLLCSLDQTHTQDVGLSELMTGLIQFEDFMGETRQSQLLLSVTEIRFGGEMTVEIYDGRSCLTVGVESQWVTFWLVSVCRDRRYSFMVRKCRSDPFSCLSLGSGSK